MLRAVGISLFVSGVIVASASLALSDVRASGGQRTGPGATAITPVGTATVLVTGVSTGLPAAPSLTSVPAENPVPPQAPTPVPTPVATPRQPHLDQLAKSIARLTAQAPGRTSVSLVELGGPLPQTWSFNGSIQIAAASTYKLPALMDDAALIASGKAANSDQICFQPGEWEDGWFSDYQNGACFPRAELAYRVGHFSDNSAAHMMVEDLGGAASLNAFAKAEGANSSNFFLNNTTTSDDLARLWAAEARGQVGGTAAQSWLYPLLTHTAYEQGIPAGIPGSATVVHKTGELDSVVNDAALVIGGSNGPYVLAVMTDGAGGDAGWSLISSISAAVWQYEAGR